MPVCHDKAPTEGGTSILSFFLMPEMNKLPRHMQVMRNVLGKGIANKTLLCIVVV